MAFIEPIILKGKHATLEPLAAEHHDALIAAASDGELWKLWYTSVPAPDQMRAYVDKALDMREQLDAMPFVIRDNHNGEIIGDRKSVV